MKHGLFGHPCVLLFAVWRIRDVYPGSDFFPFRIPDPNCLHPGSRIRIKEFKCFNPKKWFLSSRKSGLFIPDPGSGCWLLPIPDPGVKKAPDPGSRIRIRNTGCMQKQRLGSCSSAAFGGSGQSGLLFFQCWARPCWPEDSCNICIMKIIPSFSMICNYLAM